MRSNRRGFFRQTAAVVAGITAARGVEAAQPAAMPTAAARAFMAAFGLRVPIASSGMGLPAGPELAAAVSNAGGLGALGGGGGTALELAIERIRQTRAATKQPFAVNFILRTEPVALPAALDAGAPIIQFSFGIPTRDMASRIKAAGARFGVQVSSRDGARQALDLGADYLICQGNEAGGHVQALSPLARALPAVVSEAGRVPVLAAGGICTGQDIRRALEAGASGAFMGTRFLATKECAGHADHKAALLRATGDDTVLTICFQDGWIYPHRVIRNRTVDMWEAAGCPLPGRRPGEDDITATDTRTGTQRKRYWVNMPLITEQGQIGERPLYAGTGVGAVRDIPSAGELVARLWAECLAAR